MAFDADGDRTFSGIVFDGEEVAYRERDFPIDSSARTILWRGSNEANARIVVSSSSFSDLPSGGRARRIGLPALHSGQLALHLTDSISTLSRSSVLGSAVLTEESQALVSLREEGDSSTAFPPTTFRDLFVFSSAHIGRGVTFGARLFDGREGAFYAVGDETLPVLLPEDAVPDDNDVLWELSAEVLPVADKATGSVLVLGGFTGPFEEELLGLALMVLLPDGASGPSARGRLILNAQTAVPGSPGQTFDNLRIESLAIDDLYVAMSASWQNNGDTERGMFLRTPTGEWIRLVLPSVPTSAPMTQIDVDGGTLAIATGTLSTQQIFVLPGALAGLAGPVATLRPLPVVAEDDFVDDRVVRRIGFSSGGLHGNSFAFGAEFIDGSRGVYIARPTDNPDNGASAALASAILPASRSAETGQTVTAFVTVINGGSQPADQCTLGLDTDAPVRLTYTRTDPATNAASGAPNEPVTIAPGAAQSFVVSFTALGAFDPTDVNLRYDCANSAPALAIAGVNSVQLSASDTPTADVVALAATLQLSLIHI